MKIDRKSKADLKKRRHLSLLWQLPLLIISLSAASIFGTFAYVYHHIDYAADEQLFSLAQGGHTTRFYYHDDDAVSVKEEITRLSQWLPSGYRPKEWEEQRLHGASRSVWYSYAEIPQAMKDAFVAIEDKRFFAHDGVDWHRTCGAAANYLLHFDKRFGGSTITQQLIKNISADDEVSPLRKMREICRALHLERLHSKEEILELYLNIVPLSQGCVGIGAAAERYYGKQPSGLTVAECAAIAAITNSPVRYDPYTAATANKARRDLILREMMQNGMLSAADYEKALSETTEPTLPKRNMQKPLDWYTETVLSDVARDLMASKGYSREVAEQLVYHGGLQIYTQMDFRVQQALREYFEDATHFPAACQNGLRFSMVVTDPANGDLLGIISSIGEKNEDRILNYAADALRPPGSALKPLSVYAPALEEGRITWSTVLDDVPTAFLPAAHGYVAWPHNTPSVYSGLTDMQDAIAYSKNTIAVRVLEGLGVERSFSYLQRMGIRTLVRNRATTDGSVTDLASAPLALGQLSDGVSLRALTNAYGALANGGSYYPSRSYSLVLDSRGEPLLQQAAEGERVFSRDTAAIMTELLRGVTDHGTAKDLRLPASVSVAGKTGTSGEGYDKWFVGYTPYYAAGIWCGYDDGKTDIGTAAAAPLGVWSAVAARLQQVYVPYQKHGKVFPFSPLVVKRAYCKDSGLLPCEACRNDPRGNRISVGYFKAGTEPRLACTCHVEAMYDRAGGGLACDNCPKTDLASIGLLRLPQRKFPMEIYVADAQYGYCELGDVAPATGAEQPFYAPLLSAGEYVGRSYTADGKQFNCICQKHAAMPPSVYDEEETEESNHPFWWLRRFLFQTSG